MINHNELRIGNVIKKGVLQKTIVVTKKEIEACKKMPYFFNPIPIDINNIQNLGFVGNPYQDRYELGDINVEYCAVRNMLWIEKAPHVKHLHQLQNYIQDYIK